MSYYSQFEESEDIQENLQIKAFSNSQLKQLVLQLYKEYNIPIYCATYLVFVKGFGNARTALIQYQEMDVNDHNYIENDIDNKCAICLQNKEQHSFFGQGLYDIDQIVEEMKLQIQTSFNCTICFKWKFIDEVTKINQDQHQICKKCFNAYLNHEISEGNINKLICPHCNIALQEGVILTNAPECYEKYLRFIKNKEIATNPNKAWCPKIDCMNVIEFKSQNKTVKCEVCYTEVCRECKQKAHPQYNCQENIQAQLNEWQLTRDTQQCPRCKYLVEKITGCNHMTCQFCQHEWCWICGSDFTSLHYAIFNPFGCPGLMPGWIRSKDWDLTKLILWRIFCFILLIICTPIVVIAFTPVYLTVLLVNNYRFKVSSLACKIASITISLTLGIILIPVAIVAFIILFIPAIIILILYYYDERRRLEIKHQYALQRINQLEEQQQL